MAVQLLDGRGYRLRHIAPAATWPGEGPTNTTILGRAYNFTELPLEHSPAGAGLVEGSYTRRLGDSGEFSLTFPNAAGAKGMWRDRFSPSLALEFIEIYRDDVLEFVGSIQRVEIDRGMVTVSGTDAMALLRRAYERDRTWTAAPRDVLHAYTRVPRAIFADDLDSDAWTTIAGSVSFSGGRMTMTGAGGTTAQRERAVTVTSDTWRMLCKLDRFTTTNRSTIALQLRTTGGTVLANIGKAHAAILPNQYLLESAAAIVRSPTPGDKPLAQLPPLTLEMRRSGRWLSGFANGELIGFVPWEDVAGSLEVAIFVGSDLTGDVTGTFDFFRFEEETDFLARGADQGDYVLPGDYPSGGLRGRYFNAADMQGFSVADRAAIVLAPDREPYGERLDPIVDTSGGLGLPLQPGNSGDYFGVRWFGAVYLRGDLGNYTFEVTSVVDGVRLWVGKTRWGDQLIDDWTTAAGTNTGTWTASAYGSRAGWYPIVLEFFCDTSAPVIRLQFTPPGSTYTDPGGTSITASTKRVIPSTSLSPLGCYDNRVQGQPHFDLVQGVAQQFGYQLVCEPMQLESGEFPGRVVPRLRVGRDTDLVLEVDDTDRAEPVLSPGLTLDGSDQVVTLIGTGAGLPDGSGSQVTSEVTDLEALAAALFGMQTWVDAADVAFPDLLAARLNAELALRATPWEEVRGTPLAQERLADTWPLSQTLSAMRWRPGDGLRLKVPDIGVEDTAPRQLLQVTRTFGADGRTGTTVDFRQRPRSAARSVRSLLQAALASQRSYQRQKVTLTEAKDSSGGATGAGGFTGSVMIALYPQDEVVRAILRIALNTAAQALGLEINGVDRTSELGGTWSTAPVEIPITAYASQVSATDNRLFCRVQNTGGSASSIEYQLIVEVLR